MIKLIFRQRILYADMIRYAKHCQANWVYWVCTELYCKHCKQSVICFVCLPRNSCHPWHPSARPTQTCQAPFPPLPLQTMRGPCSSKWRHAADLTRLFKQWDKTALNRRYDSHMTLIWYDIMWQLWRSYVLGKAGQSCSETRTTPMKRSSSSWQSWLCGVHSGEKEGFVQLPSGENLVKWCKMNSTHLGSCFPGWIHRIHPFLALGCARDLSWPLS